uniref:Bm9817 n=1 Tax=Wuchereria bancrofti TaxID=6293 RepID=A0AAF5PY11_WUCBA
MRSLGVFAVCFLFIGATKSLEKTVKQLTANSDRWIVPNNSQNAIVSQRQLSGRFNAASIDNLLTLIMQILNRNRSNLVSPNQYTRQDWNLKHYVQSTSTANDYNQKRQTLAHLDTGGNNFDRFIISERRNDNPFLDWIVGKFNRRGLDWSNGNLRLVNMQGNSILGSDLIVHDRSVEIPLKQWLYALNSIFKPTSNY